MNQFDNKEYLEAYEEMKKFKDTTDHLAALLLINHYTHQELESVVGKLPLDLIERIEIRFQIADQLVLNQSRNMSSRADHIALSSKQESEDGKYCDFKKVLTILDSSKAKVDSLIAKGKIIAYKDAIGGKRRFIRADIYKYAEGIEK